MKDCVDDSLALAAVDFQNDAQVWGTLPAGLTSYLRTEPFPISAPPSLRSARDYGGIKIFVYQKRYLTIAHFFDGNKTDDFKRSIASANVLVFERQLHRGGFRNLPALTDFLVNTAFSAASINEHRDMLRSIIVEGSFTESAEQFNAFVSQQGIDYGLVTTSLGLLIAHGRLVICCRDRSAGHAFLSILFALAPFEALEDSSWCTYADSVQGPHEDVIVHTCHIEPARSSWLDKIKSRLQLEESGQQPTVDITNGIVKGRGRNSSKSQLVEKMIRELRDNTLQLPITFEERFNLFLAIIGNRSYRLPDQLGQLLPPSMSDADSGAKLRSFILEFFPGS